MSETWAIRWKAENGRVGTGSFRFTKEKAEEIVKELNYDYPTIIHWAVDMSLCDGKQLTHGKKLNSIS